MWTKGFSEMDVEVNGKEYAVDGEMQFSESEYGVDADGRPGYMVKCLDDVEIESVSLNGEEVTYNETLNDALIEEIKSMYYGGDM